MKMSEIKKLSPQEREKKLAEIKIDLLKLNGQVISGTTPKSPGMINKLKKTVARIKTLETQEASQKVSVTK
jgi:large subunit ribosomal protein L29